MEWFLKVVRDNYANFDGRARRKEYWMFALFNFIISCILGILAYIANVFYYLSIIVSLALIIPSIAVAVRRLHDINKSGWMILLCLIPFVNFYLIYLFFLEGDKGPNEYGEDPKADENDNPFADQNPFGHIPPPPPSDRGNNDPFASHNS
ncbi:MULTISPECIES: DUF805 domain-containing protein [Sphingobacterium]|uniref:DUF805 domain-containing protein n=1 Tax=Sphingobacterium kitahiroshimense TaxID=470446 RepID=A0ABV0BR14_9SPHI|nr:MULTISPECIES: DUF805 domain-containing protein [Sphingobacterium]MCW2261770.1 uncharacterized membrane protein YhaH (DUF805 family) [Sphingobacterium kitahiroshimense]TCR10080.1 uncharacterized membrane protein YhaH (DUF805 family) [Sphingobacterium sp. JUb78]